MGEVVMACIVLRPEARITLEAIRQFFISSGVARQKTPERLLIVDALPRNASGKVLKHELRRLQPADA